MKKMLIFVLLLFLTASLVYAVGSSTGGSSSSSSSGGGGGGSSTKTVQEPLSCEVRTTLKERIKCRFENGTEEGGTTPEACKQANEFGACITLYKNSYPCYDLSGRAKDSCFKQVSGFTKNNLQEQSVLDQSPIKNYIVVLLYDLQEMIEESFEEGEISSENSSDIVASIVEAKRKILQGKSKSEIKSDILIVKTKLGVYMK